MIEYLFSLFTKPNYEITILDSIVFLLVFIVIPVCLYFWIRYGLIEKIKEHHFKNPKNKIKLKDKNKFKRVILRFKQPISATHYDIYYKDVPAILCRYYYKRLAKKKCWDIEIIEEDELEEIVNSHYNHASEYVSDDIDFDELDSHIPRID